MFKTCLIVAAVSGVAAFVPIVPPIASLSSSSLSMSIAVFGATGLTGSECAYQLLKRGESVVALCRDTSKLTTPVGSTGSATDPLSDPKLKAITGSVTDPAAVDKVFEGGDVTGVIIALGGKTADVGDTMLTDGTTNIINSMKKSGCKRIAVVTSIGTGDSEKQAPFFFKVLMWTAMKKIFADKNNQEELFSRPGAIGADLEWTIVRPGGLTVDPPTGVINVIDGEAGSIPRADVADFCIGAVLDDDFPYRKKMPCISSVGGTSWTKDRSARAREGMAA